MTINLGFLKPMSPAALASLNTTTDRHITGKWLTVGTGLVCLLAFLNEVLDGGERSMRMATAIMDSWLLFLAAYLGISVGQYAIKRNTDTEHVERKEQAKKPPVIVPPGNGGGQQTTVNVGDEVVTTEHAAPARRPSRAMPVEPEGEDR